MFNSNTLSPQRNDFFLLWTLRSLSLIGGALSLLILLFIVFESSSVIQEIGGLSFFTDASWYPKEGLFNLVPMLAASLLAAFGAALLAAPLGILVGVFCNFYAPQSLAWFYRRCIDLLAGIPSVVYGFWGLVFLVPWIGSLRPPGASLISGIIILTIMILPTMAMTADAIFRTTSKSQLKSASALGFSKWSIIYKIVFPAARKNLFAGFILQIGRALGETMAILMVCGNVVQLPKSFFDPVRTLTANMALEMAYATGQHRSALFVSGLLLLILVVGLVFIADFFEQDLRYD